MLEETKPVGTEARVRNSTRASSNQEPSVTVATIKSKDEMLKRKYTNVQYTQSHNTSARGCISVAPEC